MMSYGIVWYDVVWYGMVWCRMVWYGMVSYGMVWYGKAWYITVTSYEHQLMPVETTHTRGQLQELRKATRRTLQIQQRRTRNKVAIAYSKMRARLRKEQRA